MSDLSRITVTMELNNLKYLRMLQAQLLARSHRSVSLSATLNAIIKLVISTKPTVAEIKEIIERKK